jgi:hypothetical protein
MHQSLGIDPAKELYDGDRPVPITDGGKPIAALEVKTRNVRPKKLRWPRSRPIGTPTNVAIMTARLETNAVRSAASTTEESS